MYFWFTGRVYILIKTKTCGCDEEMWFIYWLHWPGRGVLLPKSYVDVPAEPQKFEFFHTSFLPNYPPISIPFSIEKHPILSRLHAFYNNLLKIHPIFLIWAPSSLIKTQQSLYQISQKSTSKGTYHIPCQCKTHAGGADSFQFVRIKLGCN